MHFYNKQPEIIRRKKKTTDSLASQIYLELLPTTQAAAVIKISFFKDYNNKAISRQLFDIPIQSMQ